MPGVLPMVAALARRGLRRVVVAAAAVDEARLVDGIEVVGVETLRDAVEVVRARRAATVAPPPRRIELVEAAGTAGGDAAPTAGAAWAAGVRGPGPGRGARPGRGAARARDRPGRRSRPAADRAARLGQDAAGADDPGLLPPLDDAAALAATVVASAAGEGPIAELRRRPPFRSPHHTISYAGMVGGGPHLSPGEVTRADQGVLFLDELPEFGRDVLEALRQPLEEGRVAISRVGRATIFPARFQLVAAMNPCPCGFAGPSDRAVRLPVARPRALPAARLRAVARPDRPVDRDAAGRAARARARSRAGGLGGRRGADRGRAGRRLGRPGGTLNGRLTGRALRDACRLDRGTERRIVQLAELERASGRGTERLLRVARTIADLAGQAAVGEAHLDEAAWFRPADMRLAAAEVV